MSSIQFVVLMVLVAVIGTQGFLTKKINSEENVTTTGETYLEGIKTVAQNVKDAISSKKNTIVDAVSAVGNAKYGIIRDIKDNKKKLIESMLAAQLAKVNAIKTAKEEYIKTIMAHKQPFFVFQNKVQKIKEAIPTLPPIEGLQNRLLNFFLGFYDKFQGHFKKHKKFHNDGKDTLFAFVPHQTTEEQKPEINFFPSSTLSSNVVQTGTPSGYVQPVQEQPEFESTQTDDLYSGLYQLNHYSPSSDYDESTQNDYVPPEFSAVDFTDHQEGPYVPSPYYGSPSISPSTAYDTSN